jgi:integrase
MADPLAFDGLNLSTARKRRSVLERFAGKNGDKTLAALCSDQLQTLFDKLTPHNQRDWAKALRPFFAWCKRRRMITTSPADGLVFRKLSKPKAATCTETQFAQLCAHWPLGTDQRLWLEAAANTGARGRSDLRLFGRQHVQGTKLAFRAAKNGRNLAIPILPGLAAAIEAMPADRIQFFVSTLGSVMGPTTYSNFVADLIAKAGLGGIGLSSHSFRRLAACRLKLNRCSNSMIAAMLGDSERMVSVYVRDLDNDALIEAAFAQLEGRNVN